MEMEDREGETSSHDCDEEESHQQSSANEVQSADWMIPMKEILALLTEKPVDLSIFKVPCKLREVNEEAYSPRIVSIGPFHASTGTRSYLGQALEEINVVDLKPAKEDKNTSLFHQTQGKKHDQLVLMEVHKRWYMLHLLQKTEDQEETLNEFGKAIKNQLKSVHRSYAEKINFGSYELVEMMLVDGCFILELFIRSWFKGSPYENDFISSFEDNKYDGDLIFQTSWMRSALRQDLALLENQIPFFILSTLYEIFMLKCKLHTIPSITLLALSFFCPDMKLNKLKQEDWEKKEEEIGMKCSPDENPCRHLLDLLHNFYFPTSCEKDSASAKSKETQGFREGATKLLESGIEFVKDGIESEKVNFVDVTFDKKRGDIKIPPLNIDETTESLVRNLIAFEQCSRESNHVSSYAILMNSLVRSLPDIEVLQKKKIIKDNLGGTERVWSFFNSISMGVVQEDFCFGKLCEDVKKYQKSWRHYHRIIASCKFRGLRYWEVLKRDYFKSPWSFISFFAATVLLVLTIVQTIYTVRSYVNPH